MGVSIDGITGHLKVGRGRLLLGTCMTVSTFHLRRTTHSVIVARKDCRESSRVLSNSCYITIAGWGVLLTDNLGIVVAYGGHAGSLVSTLGIHPQTMNANSLNTKRFEHHLNEDQLSSGSLLR